MHRALAVLRGQAERVTGRVSEAPLRAALREARAHLGGMTGRLEGASPMALLQRGYVYVTTPAGAPVTSAAAVKPGRQVTAAFRRRRRGCGGPRQHGPRRRDARAPSRHPGGAGSMTASA